VLVLASDGWWRHQHDRMQQDFWWSVLGSDQPALILVGKTGAPATATNGQPADPALAPGAESNLALNDAIVTAPICSVFREYKLQCKVSQAASATVEDIHGKSLVLVGGFSNQWTRRLLAPLPYQFQMKIVSQPVAQRIRLLVEHKPTGDVILATMPSGVDASAEFSRDYAIVARFHSDITDSMAVIVAGMGRPGTSSAGQYIASPEKLKEILSRAPKDWKGKNFEAVLQTDVVEGTAGHAEVIATHFW
jgi:hypothetical protein